MERAQSFDIIFKKMEELADQSATITISAEMDELEELRRLSLELSEPESITYTRT